MSVSPTGLFALPVNYAMKSLAASTTFQTAVGAANATLAEASIFRGETDEHAAGDVKPRALLDVGKGWQFEKISTTDLFGTGPVEMVLELATPADYQGADKRRDARIWFYNILGAIIAEMHALVGQGGYLDITRFEEVNTGRADPDENNGADYWVSIWNLHWHG